MSTEHHYPEHLLAENQIATNDNIGLFHAAERGSASEVLKYIQHGAKPNFFFRPEDQKNALHVAAERGHTEVVRVLLEHGAVVDCIAVSSKATALILASHNNNEAIIVALLKAGASPNAANGYGNTPLHEACHEGHLNIATLLIESGAHINTPNHKGSTPLHTFCYGDSPTTHTMDMLKYLLQSGASVNAVDHRGATPLLVCCASGRLDFIRHLMECGADPTVRDHDKQDAHAVAVFYDRQNVATHFSGDSPFKRHGGYESKHSESKDGRK